MGHAYGTHTAHASRCCYRGSCRGRPTDRDPGPAAYPANGPAGADHCPADDPDLGAGGPCGDGRPLRTAASGGGGGATGGPGPRGTGIGPGGPGSPRRCCPGGPGRGPRRPSGPGRGPCPCRPGGSGRGSRPAAVAHGEPATRAAPGGVATGPIGSGSRPRNLDAPVRKALN